MLVELTDRELQVLKATNTDARVDETYGDEYFALWNKLSSVKSIYIEPEDEYAN